MEKILQFKYSILENDSSLQEVEKKLLEQARELTASAYAPYSQFKVAAAAILTNGTIITGTNQENAAYPVGICAERVLLGMAGTLHPETGIETLAITYRPLGKKSNTPISPCGMCRQALLEFELRTKNPIRFILSGMEGPIWQFSGTGLLLPLSFSSNNFE